MFATNSPDIMQASIIEFEGTAAEQFTIRVPAGTRAKLEEFRLKTGLRSRNQAIYELLAAGLVETELA